MKTIVRGIVHTLRLTSAVLLAILLAPGVERLWAQLQQSGGPGSTVTVGAALPAGNNNIGDVDVASVPSDPFGANADAASATGSISAKLRFIAGTGVPVTSLPALAAGANIIGFVRVLPAGCTQTTRFSSDTVQAATGAGTSVTTSTTCVTQAYANNITNSAVTLRLADRQGTPVIWLGGNADFSIPANSNIGLPIGGIVFTSGITAIAGTASAVNIHVEGYQ